MLGEFNLSSYQSNITLILHEVQLLLIFKKMARCGEMLVYDIKYSYSGLMDFWTLSIIWYSKRTLKNTTFQKLDLFPSSSEVVRDTNSVGPALG
jgi:hypothetical protein